MGSINCKEYKTESTVVPCNDTTSRPQSYEPKSCDEMDGNFVEETVCRVTDIQDNEMKALPFGEDNKILLIKENGELSAIGDKCSHYGAPLVGGALGNGVVRCPWHGACFNTKTGDIEDFPGLDSLPCYKVKIQNGEIRVRAKKSDLEKNKRIKTMVKKCESDERTFVVVGGGPSGGVAVETLRQEGFTGRIVLICKENVLPYDRIKISKALDTTGDKLQFRQAAFYEEYGIEVMLGVEATKLNTSEKTVQCSNGYSIKYDKIYIATGSRAVKPPIKGADLGNVFTIRNVTDSNAIYKLINKEMNVVCLGASFIALEAAAALVNKVKKVTLIGREEMPLKQSFGPEIGSRVLQLFEEQNVHMLMNSGIQECIAGSDGNVNSVMLKDGSIIPCDLLIMGTGTRFYTEFLKGSDVAVNTNGSIDTDMYLMSNVPDVYVGGDIANAPVFSIANQRATIGHYQLAQYHGRMAAINMAGCNRQELKAVPFFWTMLFGKGFRYAGYGTAVSHQHEGSIKDLQFVTYNFDDHGNVISVVNCAKDPGSAHFATLQSMGRRLHKNDLKDDAFAWTKTLGPAKEQRSC
ncbi:hypothetical protein ACFFRR_003887 [Megaselia abdita]